MDDGFPRIVKRNVTKVSPWVDLIARDVVFAAGEAPQTYHALGQQDYLAIVARTPDGRFLVVRQYRPAVETFTWELPAGMVDPGEEPQQCCVRELREETGYMAKTVHPLGAAAPCNARMSNSIYSFFVETGERVADFEPEPGIGTKLCTPEELVAMLRSGELNLQLHLGALFLAELNGHIRLPF